MSMFCDIGGIDLLGYIYTNLGNRIGIKDSLGDIRDDSGNYMGRISSLGYIYNDFGNYVGKIDKWGIIRNSYGKYIGVKGEVLKPIIRATVISLHVVSNKQHVKNNSRKKSKKR